MKIYTKTGDLGETGLYGGERVSKADLCIQTVGDLDELQAALGVAIAWSEHQNDDLVEILINIQKEIYILSAQIARPKDLESKLPENKKPSINKEMIKKLEEAIDELDLQLPVLQNFILLGGSKFGAQIHLARTICRRTERGLVELSLEETQDSLALEYLNRLSDLLFVMARLANQRLEQVESPLSSS